jgi:hypothetical protein
VSGVASGWAWMTDGDDPSRTGGTAGSSPSASRVQTPRGCHRIYDSGHYKGNSAQTRIPFRRSLPHRRARAATTGKPKPPGNDVFVGRMWGVERDCPSSVTSIRIASAESWARSAISDPVGAPECWTAFVVSSLATSSTSSSNGSSSSTRSSAWRACRGADGPWGRRTCRSSASGGNTGLSYPDRRG